MTPFATFEQLKLRWRDIPDAEQAHYELLLGDASYWVRQWIPGIDDRITGGSIDPLGPEIVVCNMVRRAKQVPLEGVSRLMEGAGPYTYDRQFVNPEGNMWITKKEVELLTGVVGRTATSRESRGL